MGKNVDGLIEKGFQCVFTGIKEIEKFVNISKKRKNRDIFMDIDRFEDIPLSKVNSSSNEVVNFSDKAQGRTKKPLYQISEDGEIVCKDESYIVNFYENECKYYRKAIQNLKMQGKLKIVREAFDIDGRRCIGMMSLHKKDSEENIDVYRVLNEVARLKEFGIECRLFEESRTKYFVMNILKEEEAYFRKAMQNLKIQGKFEILDDAYDSHGRRCVDKMEVRKIDSSYQYPSYKIMDEVDRLKKYGLDAVLFDEARHLYFVTNILREDEECYRVALENLNIEDQFEILDDAYDVHGRRCSERMEIRRINIDNDINVKVIYDEVDKIRGLIAC